MAVPVPTEAAVVPVVLAVEPDVAELELVLVVVVEAPGVVVVVAVWARADDARTDDDRANERAAVTAARLNRGWVMVRLRMSPRSLTSTIDEAL